jgi:hypothetical protein
MPVTLEGLKAVEGDFDEAGITVSINVPSGDHVTAGFARDLAALMGFTSSNFIRPGAIKNIALNTVTGTYIHRARQQLTGLSMKQGVDYTFWLDSDMRFPKDALVRLLMHEEPIVGCNYALRGVPTNYVGIKRVPCKDDPMGQRLITTSKSKGLEECGALGFGCILVRRDVFESLHDPRGEEGPWFDFRWDHEIQQMIGEDVYFANLVREHGWKIMCDHDLSKEIVHQGSFDYNLEQVELQMLAKHRQEQEAQAGKKRKKRKK